MRRTRQILNSLLGSALLTIIAAVLTLLYLMFTSDDGNVYREGLFGAVSFEAAENASGSTSITSGVENPVVLVVIFLVLAIVLFFTQNAYQALKQYRADLIRSQSDA